jgi:hypothetical protein
MDACSLCNGEGYAIDFKGNELPCLFCNGTGDSKKQTKSMDRSENTMIVKATLKLELDDSQKNWVSYVREQGGEEAVFHYLEEEVQKKIELADFVEMEYKDK